MFRHLAYRLRTFTSPSSRPSSPSSTSSTYVLPIILITSTTLAILYALLDPAASYSPSSPTSWFSSSASQDPSRIFAEFEAADESRNAWRWIGEEHQRLRPGVRRASWGALASQGQRASFREDLREDKKYMWAWNAGGWNNEMINLINLIYASYLAMRIPIIAPFAPHTGHLGAHPFSVAVSDIYDLNRLSAVLDDLPLVELHELKAVPELPARLTGIVYDGEHPRTDGIQVGEVIPPEAPGEETIGCWSFFESKGQTSHVWSTSLGDIGTVVANFSPLPIEVYGGNWDGTASIVELGHFLALNHHNQLPASSVERLANLSRPRPSIPPEDHVACVDMMFYFAEQTHRYDMSAEFASGQGAWNRVGKHLRWQPALKALADRYLRVAFGLAKDADVPPYMAVHIRRGDFAASVLALTQRTWAHAASEVMRSVQRESGLDLSSRVIITTDETNEEWLRPLREEYGWHVVNHTAAQTDDRLGFWFPTVLDAIFLSGATGFLGVKGSTMSILSMRRVIDWNQGVGRLVAVNHVVPEGWEWPGLDYVDEL